MGGHIRGVVTGWRPKKALVTPGMCFRRAKRFAVAGVVPGIRAERRGTTLTLTHRPIPEPMQKQTNGLAHHLDLIAAGLNGEFPKRADLFANNAALYGVDLNSSKE